jgi:hypothetical protein
VPALSQLLDGTDREPSLAARILHLSVVICFDLAFAWLSVPAYFALLSQQDGLGAYMVLSRRLVRAGFVFAILLFAWVLPAIAQTSGIDPNRGPSEFNHHIAGYALIGVGLMVIAGRVSPRLRWLQVLWPFLFIFAGLFLATWSDAEIWPRGNLSWTWLLHHDPEARQHKIYAVLLIAIGIVEYLRARGHLGRFWRTWTFPALAIFGAAFLLMHDHGGNSGVHTADVRPYLVDPALNPDGKPWRTDVSPPAETDPPHQHDMSSMDPHAMNQAGSGRPAEAASPGPPSDPVAGPPEHSSHSVMAASATKPAQTTDSEHHHHQMSPAMMLVEREHFWFMIVGFGIALFKFISDGDFWRRSFVPYLWPSTMVLLGVLLTIYHE